MSSSARIASTVQRNRRKAVVAPVVDGEKMSSGFHETHVNRSATVNRQVVRLTAFRAIGPKVTEEIGGPTFADTASFREKS